MNKNKVKWTLGAAGERISILADKFLDAKCFSMLDLYWWWDPNTSWSINKKPVEKAFNILYAEGCLQRIEVVGGLAYVCTEEFIELLLDIQRIEEILSEDYLGELKD